jgi:hypothetical protein
MIRHYQDLDVWQKAMPLIVLVYEEITSFPKEEIYVLVNSLQAKLTPAANFNALPFPESRIPNPDS